MPGSFLSLCKQPLTPPGLATAWVTVGTGPQAPGSPVLRWVLTAHGAQVLSIMSTTGPIFKDAHRTAAVYISRVPESQLPDSFEEPSGSEKEFGVTCGVGERSEVTLAERGCSSTFHLHTLLSTFPVFSSTASRPEKSSSYLRPRRQQIAIRDNHEAKKYTVTGSLLGSLVGNS